MHPFKHEGYICYEVEARVEKLRDTAHLLRYIHVDHLAQLTGLWSSINCTPGRENVHHLFRDGNPYGTVHVTSVKMVYQILVIKNGVSHDLLDGQHRRAQVTTLSFHPEAKLKCTGKYIRVCRVSRPDGEVFMSWEIIKLRQLCNTDTFRLRRDMSFTVIVS